MHKNGVYAQALYQNSSANNNNNHNNLENNNNHSMLITGAQIQQDPYLIVITCNMHIKVASVNW